MARNDQSLLDLWHLHNEETVRAFSRMAQEVGRTAVAFQSALGPMENFRAAMEEMDLLLAELAAYEEDRRRSRMPLETALGTIVFMALALVLFVALGPYGPPLALLAVFVVVLSRGWKTLPPRWPTCAYCGAPEDPSHLCHLEDH